MPRTKEQQNLFTTKLITLGLPHYGIEHSDRIIQIKLRTEHGLEITKPGQPQSYNLDWFNDHGGISTGFVNHGIGISISHKHVGIVLATNAMFPHHKDKQLQKLERSNGNIHSHNTDNPQLGNNLSTSITTDNETSMHTYAIALNTLREFKTLAGGKIPPDSDVLMVGAKDAILDDDTKTSDSIKELVKSFGVNIINPSPTERGNVHLFLGKTGIIVWQGPNGKTFPLPNICDVHIEKKNKTS
jgi:hypothetical protein